MKQAAAEKAVERRSNGPARLLTKMPARLLLQLVTLFVVCTFIIAGTLALSPQPGYDYRHARFSSIFPESAQTLPRVYPRLPRGFSKVFPGSSESLPRLLKSHVHLSIPIRLMLHDPTPSCLVPFAPALPAGYGLTGKQQKADAVKQSRIQTPSTEERDRDRKHVSRFRSFPFRRLFRDSFGSCARRALAQ